MTFLELLRQRRSRYQLADQLPITQKKLEEIITECLQQTPSAFNSQTARLLLLTGEAHKSLWRLTQRTLYPLVPASGWIKTQEKIDSFAAAYGTVLYFDDLEAIEALQLQFPIWAQQANGMLQLAVWTALAEAGIGASLQHYNPLIDEGVRELFGVQKSWKLIAQMPFGKPLDTPGAKTYLPLEQRFKSLSQPIQTIFE